MSGEQHFDKAMVDGEEIELSPSGITAFISAKLEDAIQALRSQGINLNYFLTIYPEGHVEATWMTGNDVDLGATQQAATSALNFIDGLIAKNSPPPEVKPS